MEEVAFCRYFCDMQYPKGWQDVTLAQLVELDQLRTRTDLDPEETMNQVLSVLSGVHIDEIEALPHNERIMSYSRMGWLAQYPAKKPKKRVFKLGGTHYRIVSNPAEVSAGEYATIQKIAADGLITNLHQIIACLMIEQRRGWFRWHDVRYDKTTGAQKFAERARLVREQMPVAQAYPYALFFSKLLPKLLETSLTFFQQQEKKLRKQAATG